VFLHALDAVQNIVFDDAEVVVEFVDRGRVRSADFFDFADSSHDVGLEHAVFVGNFLHFRPHGVDFEVDSLELLLGVADEFIYLFLEISNLLLFLLEISSRTGFD